MTGEEMQRTMAFILEQQAQITATQAETNSTMARLTERLDRLTERVDRNAEGITALLAIAEMHEREITDNREAQLRTDERLNALINTVERYISEGRNGRA
jgi:ABC-type transporter Mla subunit MlaD